MPGPASVLGYANMHIKFMVKSIMNMKGESTISLYFKIT